jgi:large conductance mechanosensitive channel
MLNKKKVTPLDNVEEKLKKFYNGWRSFAFKDNIINIAVGMIIATSFKAVVNSLVTDIIMPILIGLGAQTNTPNLFIVLVKGKNYNGTYNTLKDAENDGAVTLNYGIFIHVFCDLIIVSLLLYIFMKILSKIKKKENELLANIKETI